jgi:hypothetical protein
MKPFLENLPLATFKWPVATCGKRDRIGQRWTLDLALKSLEGHILGSSNL